MKSIGLMLLFSIAMSSYAADDDRSRAFVNESKECGVAIIYGDERFPIVTTLVDGEKTVKQSRWSYQGQRKWSADALEFAYNGDYHTDLIVFGRNGLYSLRRSGIIGGGVVCEDMQEVSLEDLSFFSF